jgi:hypothetical protein
VVGVSLLQVLVLVELVQVLVELELVHEVELELVHGVEVEEQVSLLEHCPSLIPAFEESEESEGRAMGG